MRTRPKNCKGGCKMQTGGMPSVGQRPDGYLDKKTGTWVQYDNGNDGWYAPETAATATPTLISVPTPKLSPQTPITPAIIPTEQPDEGDYQGGYHNDPEFGGMFNAGLNRNNPTFNAEKAANWEDPNKPNMVLPKKQDPYFRGLNRRMLSTATTGLSWLSGMAERNRQNQYQQNQFSTLGQLDGLPISNFQPTPYNLYAKYGGKLSKYQAGGSIVDYLKSQGQASDKASRRVLAEQYGIEGYDFSANKNLELLARVRKQSSVSNSSEDNRLLDGSTIPGAYYPNLKVWDPYVTGPINKKPTTVKRVNSTRPTPIINKEPETKYVENAGKEIFDLSSPFKPSVPSNKPWMYGEPNPIVKSEPATIKRPDVSSPYKPPAPTYDRKWLPTTPTVSGSVDTAPTNYVTDAGKTRFDLSSPNKPKPISTNNSPWMIGADNIVKEAISKNTKANPAGYGKSTTNQPTKNDVYHPLTNPEGYKPKVNIPSSKFRGNVDGKIDKSQTPITAARPQTSNVVNVGEKDIYHPLTNPTGYKPKIDKKVFDALKAPIQENDPLYIKKVARYIKDLQGGIERKIEQIQPEDKRSIVKTSPTISVDYGYKELYTVPDIKNPKDSLVSFINTFNNTTGGRYYVGNKMKEVTDAGAKGEFDNTQAVAHFLRDADILPNQKIAPEKWTTVKGYEFNTTSKGKTVSATGFDDPERYRMLYKPNPNGDGTQLIKYVKNKEIGKDGDKTLNVLGWQTDFTVSMQHKFSEIDWDGKGPSTGYASKSNWVPLKSGEHSYIPFKDKNGFSRFSGGSGIYLFTDPKTGEKIGVDVSGSVNTLKNTGLELIKKYGIKQEDLDFAYHDMGSYSAKPKSHNGKLNYKQWQDYNTYNRGFSGAPIMIPKK